jgi:MFS family permease
MAGRSISDPAPTSAFRLTVVLCLAEVLGMAGTMTFPALLPAFFAQWGIGNVEAGWINGVFHGGYVAAVPVLVTLTDRVDPRRIYLFSTAISALALLGFALFADGMWSATLYRTIGGVGLAGTYMPGLRILSDNTAGPRQGRYLSFYTACYALVGHLTC